MSKALKLAVIVGVSAVTFAAAASCGGGDPSSNAGDPAFQKIVASEKILTIDDVVAAGSKKSKSYDVEGLTGATSAFLAFFGPDSSSRFDVELRFYPSHQGALTDGVPPASEGTGDGMRAAKDTQTWQEGARERWFAGGVTDVSSGGSRQAPGPKYGDFMIFGNLVMLCQGANSEQALERCATLVEALGGPKAR